MQIQTLTGHLTPHDKQVVKAMFNQGIKQGKAGRTNYLIQPTEHNNVYLFRKKLMETRTIGADPTMTEHSSTFRVKHANDAK